MSITNNQCYNSWKDLLYNRKFVVPSNSRPLTNNYIKNNCDILINENKSLNFEGNSNSHLDRYTRSRHPSAIKTGCPVEINGELKYENGNYLKHKPNPIKHWRKQLFPRQGTSTRSSVSIDSLERPGGANILNLNTSIITQAIIDTNGCKKTIQSKSLSEEKIEMQNSGINILENGVLQNPKCIDAYLDTQFNAPTDKQCNYTKRSHIKNKTSFTSNYHSNTSAYLQSRVKKYEQRISIQFDKTLIKNSNNKNYNNPNCNIKLQKDYTSLYNKFRYETKSLEDIEPCKFSVPQFILQKSETLQMVKYAPSNSVFPEQSAVQSRQYIANKKRTAITQNIIVPENFYTLDKLRINQLPKFNKETLKYTNIQCPRPKNLQPTGGSGIHTRCFYTPSNKIAGVLGGTLQKVIGTGVGSLICQVDCHIYKVCCEKNNLCNLKKR